MQQSLYYISKKVRCTLCV